MANWLPPYLRVNIPNQAFSSCAASASHAAAATAFAFNAVGGGGDGVVYDAPQSLHIIKRYGQINRLPHSDRCSHGGPVGARVSEAVQAVRVEPVLHAHVQQQMLRREQVFLHTLQMAQQYLARNTFSGGVGGVKSCVGIWRSQAAAVRNGDRGRNTTIHRTQ